MSGEFFVDLFAEPLRAFVILFLVFLPLERLFPGHRQRIVRKEWFTDLLFFTGPNGEIVGLTEFK